MTVDAAPNFNSFAEMAEDDFITAYVFFTKRMLIEGHKNPELAKEYIHIATYRLMRLMNRAFDNPGQFVNNVLADRAKEPILD